MFLSPTFGATLVRKVSDLIMSYQRKKYVGRAEKLRRHKRVYRLIWLFGLLALAVWLMFNWVYVYDRVRFMLME